MTALYINSDTLVVCVDPDGGGTAWLGAATANDHARHALVDAVGPEHLVDHVLAGDGAQRRIW